MSHMPKTTTDTITVQGTDIVIFDRQGKEYICITDIARHQNPKEPKDVVKNWMRNRSTIEFLALWEKINNPDFKGVEIDPFLFEAGSNAFTMSPTKWVEATNAIGINGKHQRPPHTPGTPATRPPHPTQRHRHRADEITHRKQDTAKIEISPRANNHSEIRIP